MQVFVFCNTHFVFKDIDVQLQEGFKQVIGLMNKFQRIQMLSKETIFKQQEYPEVSVKHLNPQLTLY